MVCRPKRLALHWDSGRASCVLLLVREPSQLEQLGARLEAAQAQAAESEAVFQNLFDAIEDPITVLGLDGEILQANKAARSMFGKKLVGQKNATGRFGCKTVFVTSVLQA